MSRQFIFCISIRVRATALHRLDIETWGQTPMIILCTDGKDGVQISPVIPCHLWTLRRSMRGATALKGDALAHLPDILRIQHDATSPQPVRAKRARLRGPGQRLRRGGVNENRFLYSILIMTCYGRVDPLRWRTPASSVESCAHAHFNGASWLIFTAPAPPPEPRPASRCSSCTCCHCWRSPASLLES